MRHVVKYLSYTLLAFGVVVLVWWTLSLGSRRSTSEKRKPMEQNDSMGKEPESVSESKTSLPPPDEYISASLGDLPSMPNIVDDLMAKGFPLMPSFRKKAYLQTVKQSTPEVVADLGNLMVKELCVTDRDVFGSYQTLSGYRVSIPGNLKVLRLIEEGRENPDEMAKLLQQAIQECLAKYDDAGELWRAAQWLRRFGERGKGDGEYDARFNEYSRQFLVIHNSFYILANIGCLESDLLAKWISKEKNPVWSCKDMDVWLIDSCFHQAKPSKFRDTHVALAAGFSGGQMVRQSRWNATWDIHDGMLAVRGVDTRDIQTIEVLEIPDKIPLTEEQKDQIISNFLAYCGLPTEIPNSRRLAQQQTERQTTAEVVADLGNRQTIGDCLRNYPMGIIPWTDIMRPRLILRTNIKSLRLIEEGRSNPEAVCKLIRPMMGRVFTAYDMAYSDCMAAPREIASEDVLSVVPLEDAYYEAHQRYADPAMELNRLHMMFYSGLYIMANIEQLDATMLGSWVEKRKPKEYQCPQMDVWLIDCYYRQNGSLDCLHKRRHAELTAKVVVPGKLKVCSSKWNERFDTLNPAEVRRVKPENEIEVLKIWDIANFGLDRASEYLVIQNYLEHCRQCESPLLEQFKQ